MAVVTWAGTSVVRSFCAGTLLFSSRARCSTFFNFIPTQISKVHTIRMIIYTKLYTNRVKRKVEEMVESVRDKRRRSSVSALKFLKFPKSEASRSDLFAYNRVVSLFSAST